ncbi:MAG: hypothetical protein ISR65_19550 [Bacteriovoracaceae bacterium]|nr:hypothetical protein [Bacteriovoracaceae bacterium]
MNLFFIFGLLFSLLLPMPSHSEETLKNKIYNKIFKKKHLKIHKIEVALVYKKRSLGDVFIQVAGSKNLQNIQAQSLINILRSKLDERIIVKLKKLIHVDGSVTVEDLKTIKIDCQFDYQNLHLLINFPLEITKLNIVKNKYTAPSWAQNTTSPKNFSSYFNYMLTKNFYINQDKSHYLRGDFEFVMNYKSFVLEHWFDYDTNNHLNRRDLRVVKDDKKKLIRYSIGDLYYPTVSYQTNLPMGGVSVSRYFGLDPYNTITPVNNQEFLLKAPSKVKMYVNDILVKTSTLKAGRHSLSNLPFYDGVNNVRLEVEGRSGELETLLFKSSNSANLLQENLSDFNISIGYPYTDTDGRHYQGSKGPLFSTFYRRGINPKLTTGGFLQASRDNQLLGGEATSAFNFGVLSTELAFSSIKNSHSGYAFKLTYNWNGSIYPKYGRDRVDFVYEHLAAHFASVEDLSRYNTFGNSFLINLSHEFKNHTSLSLGSKYSFNRNQSQRNKVAFSLSLSKTFFKKLQSNIYLSTTKDEHDVRNNLIFLFFNYSFDQHNQSVNAFVDLSNNSQKLDWNYHSPKRIGGINATATLANTATSRYGELRASYLHHKFKLDADQTVSFNETSSSNKKLLAETQLQFGSAFVFAGDTFSLSRPITGSFAIFKFLNPIDKEVLINPQTGFSEGVIGKKRIPAVLASLPNYQFYKVNLDISSLEVGENIKKDELALGPNYKSGHLIAIEVDRQVELLGHLLAPNGKPIRLATGYLQSTGSIQSFKIPFFTNRSGRFLVLGLKSGIYKLFVKDSKYLAQKIIIPENVYGLKKIPPITLKMDKAKRQLNE